jgi:hypothetical protein
MMLTRYIQPTLIMIMKFKHILWAVKQMHAEYLWTNFVENVRGKWRGIVISGDFMGDGWRRVSTLGTYSPPAPFLDF